MAQIVVSRKLAREGLWRERIASCEGSGKSITQWCRDAGVSMCQYHWWKRELKRRDGPRGVTPVFSEVRLMRPALRDVSPIEVALSGERVVRVHPGFDAETLAGVVRVLERLGC